MKFFNYDRVNGNVELDNESLILIKEFEDLLEENRNKCKLDKTGKSRIRAFKELKYIYLFFDWSSPYFQYSEQDRHNEALKDSCLTIDEFDDELFRIACKKYDELQNSSIEIRLLKAAMFSVESVIFYLEHINLDERDALTGKPIFKTKDLIAEIKGCKDVISGLRDLEMQVKKGEESEAVTRGNTIVGIFD